MTPGSAVRWAAKDAVRRAADCASQPSLILIEVWCLDNKYNLPIKILELLYPPLVALNVNLLHLKTFLTPVKWIETMHMYA